MQRLPNNPGPRAEKPRSLTAVILRAVYWVGVAVGGSLFLYQIWVGALSLGEHSFNRSLPINLVIAWASAALAYWLKISAWSLIMGELSVRLPWRRAMRGYTLSFLPRYIPGSIWGYLSRGQWLLDSFGVPYSLTNGGAILEMTVAITSCVLIIIAFSAEGMLQVVPAFVTGLLPILVWLIVRRVLGWPWVQQWLRSGTVQAPMKTIRLPLWVTVIAMHTIAWLLYGNTLLHILWGFGFEVGTNLPRAVFMFSASWLIGFLVPFVPAGLGFREITLSALLIATVGLVPGQASAISVASRLFVALAELTLVLGGLALGGSHGSGVRPSFQGGHNPN